MGEMFFKKQEKKNIFDASPVWERVYSQNASEILVFDHHDGYNSISVHCHASEVYPIKFKNVYLAYNGKIIGEGITGEFMDQSNGVDFFVYKDTRFESEKSKFHPEYTGLVAIISMKG
jgi:hypothetical protein